MVLVARPVAEAVVRPVAEAKVGGRVTTRKREKEKGMVSPGGVLAEARLVLTHQVVLAVVLPFGMEIGLDRMLQGSLG